MVFIYVLLLTSNKYYIGKTNNPDIRLDSHFNSNGSKWTKIYKPIKVYELISNCDAYDEDKYTLKYMEKKGIDNVRGGSFSQVELSDEYINIISRMIKGATDKCFNCGESDHFVLGCIKSKMQSKMQEYLKDINTENIQEKRALLNLVYEKVIELNNIIKITDFISMSDLPEIKKESRFMIKLNNLRYENQKIYEEFIHRPVLVEADDPFRYFTPGTPSKRSRQDRVRQGRVRQGEIQLKIKALEKEYGYDARKSMFWEERIRRVTKSISSENPSFPKDIVILGLELIKFNLVKKKRLKEFYEEYYSEDFIKELLSKLYEKEIEIIELSLISKK